jgi:hypothetical protein
MAAGRVLGGAIRVRVGKSAPVQYSIIELDHQSEKWLEKVDYVETCGENLYYGVYTLKLG